MGGVEFAGEWWSVVEEATVGVVAPEGGARRRYVHQAHSGFPLPAGRERQREKEGPAWEDSPA